MRYTWPDIEDTALIQARLTDQFTLMGLGKYSTAGAHEVALIELMAAFEGRAVPPTPEPANTPAAWPVGSVFVGVESTNPAELLGFGTWEAVGAGQFVTTK